MKAELAKCSCSHCDGHLEFDTAHAGARITCPHCGKETVLYVPATAVPPPIPAPVPAPATAAAQFAVRVVQPAGPPAAPSRLADALPRNTNSFARQAARASWVSFIFSYGFAHMAPGLGFAEMTLIFQVAAALFMIIGVTLGIIALFGIRKHGTKGILVPAIVGLVLNGLVPGAIFIAIGTGLIRQPDVQELNRKAEASFQDCIRQLKSGARVLHMQPTGNADLDAGIQIVVDLVNDMSAAIDKMDAELTQLKERDVSVVLTNRVTVKSELDKRSAGLAIIEKCKRDTTARVASAKQRCVASKLPKNMKQDLQLSLDKCDQFMPVLSEGLSLRSRSQQTQFDFLQFMYSESGHYMIVSGSVRFTTSGKVDEFNRLTQRIRDVYNDAQAFDRRRNEMLKSELNQGSSR